MKKIGIFCVGTGGHVLPAKNLILQLNEEGVSLEKFIVVTDERGSQYLKDLDINPADVEEEMKKWLWRYRDGGQFAKVE